LIYFENVSKIYDKSETYAVSNIELAINEGEFVFLVGMSGAGKSTLIKLLQSELSPTYGKVVVNDTDTSTLSGRTLPRYRRMIGMIFQDPLSALNPLQRIGLQIEEGLIYHTNLNLEERKQYALQLVGLEDKEDSYPNQLSGGEQQRVAIARAIVNRPPILIADEPTGNLDLQNSIQIMKLLNAINEQGTTVIVATHDKEVVDAMQKRVIRIEQGRIVSDIQRGRYMND